MVGSAAMRWRRRAGELLPMDRARAICAGYRLILASQPALQQEIFGALLLESGPDSIFRPSKINSICIITATLRTGFRPSSASQPIGSLPNSTSLEKDVTIYRAIFPVNNHRPAVVNRPSQGLLSSSVGLETPSHQVQYYNSACHPVKVWPIECNTTWGLRIGYLKLRDLEGGGLARERSEVAIHTRRPRWQP